MEIPIQSAKIDLSGKWEPFKSNGVHLTFRQHVSERLRRDRCTHWDAAVYKWEGTLTAGPHSGKTGILIGETSDIRQRIKQYVTGTQKSGNELWRETFLTLGDIRLFVFCFGRFVETFSGTSRQVSGQDVLENGARRQAVEQLLVVKAVEEAKGLLWIVNSRQ